MTEEDESMGEKLKRHLSFRIGKPKNPFKGNPYKEKRDSEE
jgi:hypothetical protein